MKDTLEAIKSSYKQGYKDAIDNVCKWIEERQVIDLEVPDIEKLICDLRKEMEDKEL